MTPFLNQLDQSLISLVLRLPGSWKPLMEAASVIGQPLVMAALIAVIAVAGGRRGHPVIFWAGVGAMLGIGLSTVLKLVLHRTRPDTYVPLVAHSYSFPSGHAMATSIVLTLCAYLASQHLSAPWNYLIIAGCIGLIVLVGVSRVFLGAHYPTDVLGGWVLGLAVVAAIIKVVKL